MVEKKDWKMVTTKLPEDVHASLLVIKEAYGENMGDALRMYIREHTPEILARGVEVVTAKREVSKVIRRGSQGAKKRSE